MGVSSWIPQAGVVRLGAVGRGGSLGVHAFLPPSTPAVSCPTSEGSRGGDSEGWGRTPKLHHQMCEALIGK